jgi:hypothetical protein
VGAMRKYVVGGALTLSILLAGVAEAAPSRPFSATSGMIPFCTSCISSTVIAPALLEVNARELPGFTRDHAYHFASTSVAIWARESEEKKGEAEETEAYLTREGFVEGAASFIPGDKREAVEEALVFGSAAGAQHTLVRRAGELAKLEMHGESSKRFRVKLIPGSIGIDFFQRGKPGAASNVLFATGRCYVVVADRVENAATLAQAEKAPVTAARRLYGRVRAVCG